QAVREKAMMAIRAAEAKANAGKPVIDPKGLGRYAEGGKTQKLSGTLTRVECLGKTANLHVASGKRVVQIRVADPGQVELSGGGQMALTCGAQRAGRKVVVEYMPVAETNAAVSGEAVRVELGR
ncbi:MAG TPA: hypothetical protein VES20_15685, partial [Bryobacteraceae bacterium]|nr:hypothetical protein [Bryobacteraceae bacterium]